MRCPRCGNENPGTNRFCGMCGATLLPAPPTASATQATAVSPAPVPSPAPAPPAPPAPRPPARAQETPSPSISGPSFLGLNDPPPAPRRGSLSIDPNAHSRNLDYLLEDEEPHRGGAGKYFLILIALLLAVGLGYLRWKNGGFGFLNPPKKPSAAATTDDATDSTASQPATASQPPATTPNSSASSTPSITPIPAQDGSSPANSAPTANPSTPAAAPAADAASPETPAASTPSASSPKNSPPATTDSDSDTADTPAAPPPKPKPAPKVADKPKPTPAFDAVAEAQKYLYGKGARQDCDRGLRLLKPQADRANPKAMVEMGALYSAGLCTPRDLPTAYRWFALALRKDPENQSAQADLQKLWGEMTQPERQLAIKLSQ